MGIPVDAREKAGRLTIEKREAGLINGLGGVHAGQRDGGWP